MGPTATSGSDVGPTFRARNACTASACASAARLAGTSRRVPAMQAWPLFITAAWTAIGTALAKCASSSRTVGDFPPSSSVTRFMVSTAPRAIALPTAVEPVNEILAMSGWRVISAPTASPRPVTMLTTPGGRPARCSARVMTSVCTALNSLGLITALLPAAMAIASLLAMKPAFAFHGVIMPTTPCGTMVTRAPPTSRSNG